MGTEHASLEREIFIDASPEVVFDVVSNPEHVQRWWPDEADYPVVAGEGGRIRFGDPDRGGQWVQLCVVDALPPRSFSFRWAYEEGLAPERGNSFLVVFELEPRGSGTLLRMTETGFRERGWDDAKVAAEYADHVSGWDLFLPRIAPYAAGLEVRP